jgi:hypothetical protein
MTEKNDDETTLEPYCSEQFKNHHSSQIPETPSANQNLFGTLTVQKQNQDRSDGRVSHSNKLHQSE